MRVLGIETSCDETGIAIYDDEKGLLANQLYSQVKLHADYGGVVPELASRDHVRKTVPLIQAALKESGLTAKEIDAVAYTAGPGLVGRCWSARPLAVRWRLPECSGDSGTPYGRAPAGADAGRQSAGISVRGAAGLRRSYPTYQRDRDWSVCAVRRIH